MGGVGARRSVCRFPPPVADNCLRRSGLSLQIMFARVCCKFCSGCSINVYEPSSDCGNGPYDPPIGTMPCGFEA
jgi:hypothetical protein